MKRQSHIPHILYDGSALIADPIHEYISFTVPYSTPDPGERTEKDLIDSPWVQRLRYVFQLQSARWVYPSAEHSRFVHSLGTMHVAGRFARHLYPFLATQFPHVPSIHYVEELLRVTALLHDIGHGPFCHFFDDNFLKAFHLTHEKLGQVIIRDHLGPIIQKIRRSPSGPFAKGESLDPRHIAHLILKEQGKDNSRMPPWLNALQPVISGSYTGDNLDYVLRDAYMCGVAVGPNFAVASRLVETAAKCCCTAASTAPDRRSPVSSHSRAECALVRVSCVVKVFDETTNRVVWGFRPESVAARWAPSMFETKCTRKLGEQ